MTRETQAQNIALRLSLCRSEQILTNHILIKKPIAMTKKREDNRLKVIKLRVYSSLFSVVKIVKTVHKIKFFLLNPIWRYI